MVYYEIVEDIYNARGLLLNSNWTQNMIDTLVFVCFCRKHYIVLSFSLSCVSALNIYFNLKLQFNMLFFWIFLHKFWYIGYDELLRLWMRFT